MKTLVSIVLLCLFSSLTSAYELDFKYDGSKDQVLRINEMVNATLYRQEPYQSTCYNYENYESYECDYETTYTQECGYSGGGQSCHYEPGREICKNGRCRQRDGREVCTNNSPTYSCDNVPTRVEVCGYVTKTRSIPYSCTKYKTVPYQDVVDSKHIVKVIFKGSTKLADVNFKLKFNSELNKFDLIIKNTNKDEVVILTKKERDSKDTRFNHRTQLTINFKKVDELKKELRVNISKIQVSRLGLIKINTFKSQEFKKLNTNLHISSYKTDKLRFNKDINLEEFTKNPLNEESVELSRDLKSIGFKKLTLIGRLFNKRFNVIFTFTPNGYDVPSDRREEFKTVLKYKLKANKK